MSQQEEDGPLSLPQLNRLIEASFVWDEISVSNVDVTVIPSQLVSIFKFSSSPSNSVYVRRVDSSTLVFSLSSHRHSYIGLVFSSHFIDS